jgi:ribonuclease-3
VLDLALGAHLIAVLPDAPEGEISRVKNQLRSGRFCAVVARNEGLGERMAALVEDTPHARAGRTLMTSRGVLADLAESALGAIFLARGWEAARDAAVAAFAPLLPHALDPDVDPKTALQEAGQRQGRRVAYELVEETGPAHARHFRAHALLDGRIAGVGEGGSRRAAEQAAARRALRDLEGGGAA